MGSLSLSGRRGSEAGDDGEEGEECGDGGASVSVPVHTCSTL